MGRLVWSGINERRAELGVSRGVLYPHGKNGVVWNGLISVSESSSGGESVDLWADNIKYASFRSSTFFEGTIEAYNSPDEFAECDGRAKIEDGVYIHQQVRNPFDFCFRSEIVNGQLGTKGYLLHMIYNCTASPPERTYETFNDSPDAITYSWDITSTPFMVNGHRASSTIILDSTKIDRIKLEALEKILYGLGDDPPYMPNPDEVIELVRRLDFERSLINILSTHGHWLWDTFSFREDTIPIAIEKESRRHIYFNPESGTEYIQPSIAYSLVSEFEGIRRYMLYVIDYKNPSQLALDISSFFDSPITRTTSVDGRYFYFFDLQVQ